MGPHLTINDCTSVRLFAYMSEQDKKKSLKHNKELFKEEVGYDVFEILFIWQSKFYRDRFLKSVITYHKSCVSLSSMIPNSYYLTQSEEIWFCLLCWTEKDI